MGLSIKDIVELAKAGYKVSEVKELMSLGEMAASETKTEEPPAGSGAISEPKPDTGEAKVPTENAQPEKPENSIDYKLLYEQTKADLDKAQKANINQNAAPVQSSDPTKELRATISTYL